MSRETLFKTVKDISLIEIKSKFEAEFRRFGINKNEYTVYDHFKSLVEKLHRLSDVPFLIYYTDPKDGDMLPINNDDNFARAVLTARPLLRIIIQRKGECIEEVNGYNSYKYRNIISSILGGTPGKSKSHHPWISNPQDFRQVSAIIDVDIVPETCRRVRLLKNGSDRPLGFYIRDGTSVRLTPSGMEKIPSIFISRLVPGGLAESTGLLAVNDEVLEVNGIEVTGKTLDQVTDMMVANSYNLIITVKPANQKLQMPRRGSISRTSQLSAGSAQSAATTVNTSEEEDKDEVVSFT